MGSDLFLIEKRDHIAQITINRPEKMNAFSRQMNFDFLRILDEIDQDESTHAVILTGKGRAFCTGHDLSDPPEPPAFRLSRHAGGRQFGKICDKLINLRQPIVAAIGGWCAAGGLGFAICCDLLIAGDDAFFYTPQIVYGYPSMPGIGALLNSYVSVAWVKDMILGRRKVDAQTAERIGLVSRVVPRAKLLDEAWDAANKLAEVPPDIMAMQREMMNKIWVGVTGTYAAMYAGRHTAIAGHSLPDWEEREAGWKKILR